MLTPKLTPAPSVIFPDDEGEITVTAWITPDGADDTPEWARDARHVQIDTDDGTFRGVVIHLNDGPPIYQGNPEVHESAAEVLRRVRKVLTNSGDYELDVRVALDIIRMSGVVL